MRAAACLQFGEEVSDMGFDRLFRQEEFGPDLTVYEAVRDELENFNLPRRWLLLEFSNRVLDRNYVGRSSLVAPSSRSLVKAT